MVKGVLYTTGGTRRSVIALDGKTGELIWSHSLREGKRAANAPRQLSGRGVGYWTDGRGDERKLSARRESERHAKPYRLARRQCQPDAEPAGAVAHASARGDCCYS